MAQETTAIARAGRSVLEHPDGVYLGLAEEAYQEDDALGYTAIKVVKKSPPQWWWKSAHNAIEPQPSAALREEEDTQYQRLGRAVHVALLEGLDVYNTCYGILPTKETHPDALDTMDELREACRDLRIPSSAPRKEDLIARLVEADPNIQILELLQKEWRRESGQRPILAREHARVRLLHRMAMASPEEFQIAEGEVTTLRGAFMGGLSEVSVFWTDENGIRQRARFDKLKPRVSLDVKTFSDWNDDFDFDTGLLREIKHRKYEFQAVHYDIARHQLIRLVKEGKVYGGSPEQRALLEEIAESEVWTWMWVFCITVGAPLVKGIVYDLGGVRAADFHMQREDALSRFLFYRETFGGFEQMWIDPVGIITPDDDAIATA